MPQWRLRFSRPSGTGFIIVMFVPGVETPGYYQASSGRAFS